MRTRWLLIDLTLRVGNPPAIDGAASAIGASVERPLSGAAYRRDATPPGIRTLHDRSQEAEQVTRRIAEGTRRRIRRASLWLRRRATPPAAPGDGEAPARGTTRRGFIQIGAASSVAVVGLSRVLPARAEPEPFFLTITEGDVTMEDGTPVFFRGVRSTGAIKDVPSIPGPPIGNTGPGIKGRDVFAGDDVLIMVTNSTPRDHTFLIARVDADDLSPAPDPAELVKMTTIPP